MGNYAICRSGILFQTERGSPSADHRTDTGNVAGIPRQQARTSAGKCRLNSKPGAGFSYGKARRRTNMPSAACSPHGNPSASIHRSRKPGSNTSADEILTENLCDTFPVSGSFRAETRREYSARNSSGCCPTVVTKATHASSGPSHNLHTLHFRNNYCSTVFCRLQVIRAKFTAD